MNSGILLHLSAFNDSREAVRVIAARRVATYGAEAAPLMIQLLGEDEGFSRECAILALTEMGKPAIPFLTEALQNSSETIRRQAAILLSAIDEEAVGDAQGRLITA